MALPISANLRAHYDFNELSSIGFDTTGGVSSVLDQSPLGNDLFQALTTNRPTTGTINGVSGIDCSDTGFMRTTSNVLSSTEDRTIFIVTEPTNDNAGTILSLTQTTDRWDLDYQTPSDIFLRSLQVLLKIVISVSLICLPSMSEESFGLVSSLILILFFSLMSSQIVIRLLTEHLHPSSK